MPSYKLTYFNVRARAELTRLLFALGGVEYEDIRVTGEEWAKLKPSVATGALPILEVDGVQLNQSMAIARYVATVCKLAGSNDLEAAQCDAVVETTVEIGTGVMALFFEKDETKKEELKKTIWTDKVTPKLAILEKMLTANGDVFVGKTLTLADLSVYNMIAFSSGFLGDNMNLADFPKLVALNEKVTKDPKIAAWIAKRPESSM